MICSERQPKITLQLDVEQNNMICNEPSTLHTHKEKYILDGMIDLTGKGGPMVGVLKVKSKDAKNDDSMGRIQARRREYVSDHTGYFFCIRFEACV